MYNARLRLHPIEEFVVSKKVFKYLDVSPLNASAVIEKSYKLLVQTPP